MSPVIALLTSLFHRNLQLLLPTLILLRDFPLCVLLESLGHIIFAGSLFNTEEVFVSLLSPLQILLDFGTDVRLNNLPFRPSECSDFSSTQSDQCAKFLSSMSVCRPFSLVFVFRYNIARNIKLLQRPAPHFSPHPSLMCALLSPSLQHVDSISTNRSASQ
jgi:hypothetical protein